MEGAVDSREEEEERGEEDRGAEDDVLGEVEVCGEIREGRVVRGASKKLLGWHGGPTK